MGRRRTLRLGVLIMVAAVVATVLLVAGPAPAADPPSVILVHGQFKTYSTTCPSGNEFCAIDKLTGDIEGFNTLTLLTCQPSPACMTAPETLPLIAYHDSVETQTQYGTFVGDEHGTIKPLSGGDLNAFDVLTSKDGCGSQLFLHNQGTIDVTTFLDEGVYDGELILRPC